MNKEESTSIKHFVDEVRNGEFIGKTRMYYGTGIKDIDGTDLFEGDLMGAIDKRGIGLIIKYDDHFIILFANMDNGDIYECEKMRRIGNIINDAHLLDGSEIRSWQVVMEL